MASKAHNTNEAIRYLHMYYRKKGQSCLSPNTVCVHNVYNALACVVYTCGIYLITACLVVKLESNNFNYLTRPTTSEGSTPRKMSNAPSSCVRCKTCGGALPWSYLWRWGPCSGPAGTAPHRSWPQGSHFYYNPSTTFCSITFLKLAS
jgi:hypothetical protein